MTSGCCRICFTLEREQQHQWSQQCQQRTRAQPPDATAALHFACPLRAGRRQRCAMISGTTIYRTTEMSSVSHGTVIDASRAAAPTIGAKANTMITSLSATCDSVKCGSPSVRRLHTNTIAVHGAAASRIRPAM